MQSEQEILAELNASIAIRKETAAAHRADIAQMVSLVGQATTTLKRMADNAERLTTLETGLQALNEGINNLPQLIHGREIEAGKIIRNLGI